MYTHTYIYIYAHTHIYLYIYLYIYVFIYICIHTPYLIVGERVCVKLDELRERVSDLFRVCVMCLEFGKVVG